MSFLAADNGYSEGHMAKSSNDNLLSPPEVMTIYDLAAYLHVPQSSLCKLPRDGKVPGQWVGRHWRLPKQVIDEWLHGWEGGEP